MPLMVAERRARSWLILGLPVVLAVATWFLFPVSFVRGLLVGVVTGAAGIVVGFRFFVRRIRRRMDEGLKPPPLPGTHWDYALQAIDLDGSTFDFASCKGRPLVLNHWATWCGPCVAEMPSLVRLRTALSDLDVEVACISRESAEKVKEFMAKNSFDLPVLTLEASLPECFSSRAIPATYVLDRSGRIVLRHLGAAAWDDPSVVAFIRNLAQAPEL